MVHGYRSWSSKLIRPTATRLLPPGAEIFSRLASLTVAQLHLDEPIPLAALDAADEKNREGSEIVLREDLAADLRGLAGLQAGNAPERSPAARRGHSCAVAAGNACF
jgi:hypothetical protein